MKERELSLLDLIFDILLHWRSIVVAMLIGAVVLGGFSYARSYSAYAAQVAQVETAKQELEEMIAAGEVAPEASQMVQEWLKKELTEAQIHNIQNVLLYEQMYEEMLAYMDEDIWMQTDSTLVYQAELTFKVTAANAEYANNIERVYEDAAVSGELRERLADELGTSSAAVDNIYLLTRSTAGLAEGGDTFSVSLKHYNKAACEKMAEVVISFIKEKCTAFQETLGGHEIVVANQSLAELTDTDLLNYQNKYYNDLISLQNTITGLKEAFSISELQYYDIQVNGELTELSEEASEDLEKADDEKTAESAETPADIVARGVTVTPGISLKYIILGMILGAFVLIFWHFIAYIINSKVRATDNLHDIYDIPQLGQIKALSTGKKLFGFVDKWVISLRDFNKRSFTEEEALELASVAIKMAAGKQGLDTVYLIGSDLKGYSLRACEQLKARLDKDSIHIEILNNVLYDAQAMCDLEKAQAVVLLETVGSTLYSEIARELELFNRQGVCVLGGILVE